MQNRSQVRILLAAIQLPIAQGRVSLVFFDSMSKNDHLETVLDLLQATGRTVGCGSASRSFRRRRSTWQFCKGRTAVAEQQEGNCERTYSTIAVGRKPVSDFPGGRIVSRHSNGVFRTIEMSPAGEWRHLPLVRSDWQAATGWLSSIAPTDRNSSALFSGRQSMAASLVQLRTQTVP